MDYQSLLFDPIYLIQGVPAVLTLPDSGDMYVFTGLDKTAGVDIGDDGPQVQTIKPAACMRVVEILAAGLTLDQLPDCDLEMNGFAWNVVSFRLKPSPKGENDGEVYLILAGKVPVIVPLHAIHLLSGDMAGFALGLSGDAGTGVVLLSGDMA